MKYLICFSKSHYFTTEGISDKQVKITHWATLCLSLLLGAGSIKKSAQMLGISLMNPSPGWSFERLQWCVSINSHNWCHVKC